MDLGDDCGILSLVELRVTSQYRPKYVPYSVRTIGVCERPLYALRSLSGQVIVTVPLMPSPSTKKVASLFEDGFALVYVILVTLADGKVTTKLPEAT